MLKLKFTTFLVITALTLLGCGRQRETATTPAAIAPSPSIVSQGDPIPALRDEAQKRGLYWNVWCTTSRKEDPPRYQAVATKGEALNIYIEDGAEPYWQKGGFNSKEEAARWLLDAIKQAPTNQPYHKPSESNWHCEDEVKGGPAATASPKKEGNKKQ